MHCDKSGGIDTLSIGMPVSVRNSIAAVSRSSRASVTRARAAWSRSSACCWSAMLIEPLDTPSRRSPARRSWNVTLSCAIATSRCWSR